MKARDVGLRVAVVAVVAAVGLGVSAGPAAAMVDDDCAYPARMSNMAATIMQETTSYEMWNRAYTLWLAAENYLDSYC